MRIKKKKKGKKVRLLLNQFEKITALSRPSSLYAHFSCSVLWIKFFIHFGDKPQTVNIIQCL